MCGIAGLVRHRQDAPPVTAREIRALRDAQRHRGPDDAGEWLSADGAVGFGHRRLSIIDLSPLGHQPMATPDGTLRIVFNGEIYNFRALRTELEAKGYAFVSTSDTEVLLHGFRAWGLGLLDRLRGMFAFALHDAASGETLLARDPLGIKPLYVSDRGGRLAFASEIQALRLHGEDDRVDEEALASFLLWGSIAPPRTLYRDIRALPAGSWMRVGRDRVEGPTSYYRMEEELGCAQPMDPDEAARQLRDALVDSTRHHLVADVPVGAFLSGGVDSSALVGLLAEVHGGPIRAVTLCFDVPDLDESRLAALAAQRYGAEHHPVLIKIEEIRERIPDAVRALDQPSIDGINTFFVAEAAARVGLKVAVSGVGGDELFGGYASFRRVPRFQAIHRAASPVPLLGRAIERLGRGLEGLPRTRRGAKLARALAFGGDSLGAYYVERGLFSPREAQALLAPELEGALRTCDPRQELARRIRVDGLPDDERVTALESRQYLEVQLLRDTDAASMRHSLEVRTPLVDRELLRAAARVPPRLRRAGPAKRALRESARPPVPPELWQRRKQGFTLPFEAWLRARAVPLALPRHALLRAAAVERVERDFRGGRLHWSRLWALLVLGEFLALPPPAPPRVA